MKKEYTVTVNVNMVLPVKFVMAENVKQAELQALKYVTKMTGMLPGHWHPYIDVTINETERS